MIKTIRRMKMLYEMYNIFHYNKLKYQLPLYRSYGVNKSFFSSLSSSDFPNDSLTDHPWLDKVDSAAILPENPIFSKLDPKIQSSILNWSSDGYTILKGFYPEDKVASINDLILKLMKDKRMPVKDGRKIMYAVRYSKEMRDMVNTPELVQILDLLMGRSVELFQSVNFFQGSEDPAHSDFIHMSTYPYGYLMAVWIALEDMDLENGPLFFYPGSHKLEYIMNSKFDHGGNRWFLGKENKNNYAKVIEKLIEEQKLEKKIFTASKGDVLIWHANLLHGG